jgi:hypothetical protein
VRVVRQIRSHDRKHLVEIYERDSGTFGFVTLRWDEEVQCFVPFGRYAESFADSVERAVAEASARVDWLAESIRTGTPVEISDRAT